MIRPAGLIYFDTACTVLSTYSPGSTSDEDTGPELDRFIEGSNGYYDPFDLPERAANQLPEEVGLEFGVVRDTLTKLLLGRLEELEENIRYVEGSLPDLLPGDALRIIQVAEYDLDAISNRGVMRSRTYPHGEGDPGAFRCSSGTARSSWLEHATVPTK
ncbi:hypothetical protein [Streptomyces sp. NPDC087212]|uniref:hypothetical protein n=1 Tax=Streptomyces sp. NPDC087212 TaxID=3365766 RepID=UPI003820C79D